MDVQRLRLWRKVDQVVLHVFVGYKPITITLKLFCVRHIAHVIFESHFVEILAEFLQTVVDMVFVVEKTVKNGNVLQIDNLDEYYGYIYYGTYCRN